MEFLTGIAEDSGDFRHTPAADVHIFYLIGFRNRVLVLTEWAWVYLRNERGARLITGEVEPLLERGEHRTEQ